MSKIPVGATIAQAYRFAFGGFAQILRIIWLPWLIVAAGGFLLRPSTVVLSTAFTTRDFANISHLLMPMIPFYVLTVILLFMQITGITQQALGLPTGSPYYYFSVGKPVWRLLVAFLLAAAIMAGSYIFLLAAGILLGLIVSVLGKLMNFSDLTRGVLAIAGVIAFMMAFCAYIYTLVRLTFFLNPITVAEQQISLKRSWALGRGNFWRIVLVMLAIVVPIMAVQLVLLFGFLMHGLPPTVPLHATADQIAANRALIAAWNADMIKRGNDYWYIVYPIYAVIAGLFYGLGCGAQCFAYRALVPGAPSASPL